MYYTYMIRCADNSIYTGMTNNLEKRIEEHITKDKRGAKYTKSRRPVELVYYETFSQKEDAMRREYAIKQLNRAGKRKLVENFEFR